jgi:hypothetical protein
MPEDLEQPGEVYTLRLTKGVELFVVRYRSGDENAAVGAIVDLTCGPEPLLTFHEASALLRQVNVNVAAELKAYLPNVNP